MLEGEMQELSHSIMKHLHRQQDEYPIR